jgi:hypothetical protein
VPHLRLRRRRPPRAAGGLLPAAAGFVAIALALTAPGCRRQTPEAAIRALLDDAVAALAARDVTRAARHLSPAYKDTLGRTGQQLRGLAFWVLRRGPVTVILRDTKILVDGETATVTTVAHAFQGRTQIDRLADLVPQGAERFELTIHLAREDGTWKVRALDGDGTNPELAP